jgi:hypothetical protein
MRLRGVLQLLAVSLVFAGAWWASSRWESPAPAPEAKVDARPAAKPVPPPDLRALAMRMGGGGTAAPTPGQVQEERATIAAQIAAAGESLHHADPQERIGGAMQLAAYPAPEDESETARTNALIALQSFLQKQERDAPRYKTIMKALRQKAKDRRLAQDIRQEIQDYLQDQS